MTLTSKSLYQKKTNFRRKQTCCSNRFCNLVTYNKRENHNENVLIIKPLPESGVLWDEDGRCLSGSLRSTIELLRTSLLCNIQSCRNQT